MVEKDQEYHGDTPPLTREDFGWIIDNMEQWTDCDLETGFGKEAVPTLRKLYPYIVDEGGINQTDNNTYSPSQRIS
jgi:hypothetical protein